MSPQSIFPAARLAAAALFALSATQVAAVAPQDLLRGYEATATAQSPGYAGASAERGARLFRTPQGREWSCASCHGESPVAAGRHARTAKTIQPLAPATNARRFTDAAEAEKWFKRNCGDVFGRECTAAEKGDVLAWLLSFK